MFSRPPIDAHAPVPGSLIGRWRLLERVGRGNNGITYRACLAQEPGAGEYALKLALGPFDARFEREAELLSRLSHPHIPGLRDRGTWKVGKVEYPYLVMQWVEGVLLYDWAKQRGLTSRQALRLLAQVARALEATHKHGTSFLALPLPKKPAPGQRRPPCDADHRVINGLCWWLVTTRSPPSCGDAYEHDDKCFVPVVPSARPPTSEDP